MSSLADMDVIGSVEYEMVKCNSKHVTYIQARIDVVRFHATMFSSRRRRQLKSISNDGAVPSR